MKKILEKEIISKMKEELADKDAVLFLFRDIKNSEAYQRLERLYSDLERMIRMEENGFERFKKI